MTNKQIFYITTPIYYPNDIPHIGHAYTTIAADVLARFHRSLGEEVLFSTGTDEHGQKIEEAAKKSGQSTKHFLDKLILQFKDAWTKLDISYDIFIRTTDEAHKKSVIELIKRCNENGDIYKGFYEGLYCKGCEAYYLEGDLDEEGRCKIHKTKAEKVKEESYFFKLSNYQAKLLEFYKNNPDFLSPRSKRDEIINRVTEGLHDISITRTSFNWGITFPLDKKHVIYVWFDALTNYITCAGFPDDGKKFEEFWPANVHLVGKDIMWFHQVLWPAMLMSGNLSPPKKVFAHGWWTVDGEKMSKTLGNVISPIDIADKFGTDELRYFLLREASFGEDGDFSEKSFMQRINSELSDDLGNLLSRVLTLIIKNFDSKIPEKSVHASLDDELVKSFDILNEYKKHMDSLEFNNALVSVFKIIQAANKYVNDTKPWQEKDKERLGTILFNVSESLRLISIYLWPFMPTKAELIRKSLGLENESFKTLNHHISSGKNVEKSGNLFKKHDLVAYEKSLKKDLSVIHKEIPDGFSILNLKVGKIIEIKKHPDADKLFIEKIDFGNETRQIVSGLADYYAPEELLNKKVVVVTNLKPAKIRGQVSQGMLLAGEENNVVGVLYLENADLGKQVHITGETSMINTKEISFEDFLKVKMEVIDGVAMFEHKELKVDNETVKVEKIMTGKIR